MRGRVNDYAVNAVNNFERVVLIACDLQRQQLGVDARPEGALIFLTLTDPLGHAGDAANVLGEGTLRTDFFRLPF
jgi:hypothetical protein